MPKTPGVTVKLKSTEISRRLSRTYTPSLKPAILKKYSGVKISNERFT